MPPWLGIKRNSKKTEVKGNVVIQNDVKLRSLPQNFSWLIKMDNSMDTWIKLSHTPNSSLGDFWVNMQCDMSDTTDRGSRLLHDDTTAKIPPPRTYLLEVGIYQCCHFSD